VNIRVDFIDVLAVLALVMIILLGLVVITPTSITQNVSAYGILQSPGNSATYFLNFSASGGYRSMDLAVSDIHFNAPSNWSFSITSIYFVLQTGHNFSDIVNVYIPAGAMLGSNATLSFTLHAKGNSAAYSQSFVFRTVASTSYFVQKVGSVLVLGLQGFNFVPWYAVVGPLSSILAIVAAGVALSRYERF